MKGMPETIAGFDPILRDCGVGRVAIITHRCLPMARLDPPVELRPHDVAIHASRGIVRQVGEALRIMEGVPRKPD